MPALSRRLVAEAFGTFGLVFFGCASVVVNLLPGVNFGVLGVALAHALALSVLVTATMAISGGQLNPAVTIGLLVGRRMAPAEAGAYIAAQLVGGVLAALCVKLLLPTGAAMTTMYGTPVLGASTSMGSGIALEALLTFFLMSAYYGTLISADAPKVGGFGVGLTLIFAMLVAGPLTGAALNPARAFGPALIAGSWTAHIVYWVGPIIGAGVAALLWEHVLLPPRANGTAA